MRINLQRIVGALLLINAAVVSAGELVGSEAIRERMYPNVVDPDLVVGRHGAGAAEFLQIRKVLFNGERSFVVADCAANRIQEFDLAGALLRTIDTACPSDIAITGEHLFALSEQEGSITVFKLKSGKKVRSWQVDNVGAKGISLISAGEKFIYAIPPRGGQVVVYDIYGRPFRHIALPVVSRISSAVVQEPLLYLADKLGARVLAVNIHSGEIKSFGQYGTFAGELANPHGLSVSSGKIYVVDSVNHRVQRFSGDGEFDLQFGRHPVSPHEATPGRMHYPHHIAVNSSGTRAIVCEPFESRCNIFTVRSVEEKYTKSTESAWWNKFFYFHYRGPSAAIDKVRMKIPVDSDYLFMGEEDIHRIVVSKVIDGVPQTVVAFGEFGEGPGQFKGPEGVFPGRQGNLYVSDTGNNRIQVFDFQGNFKFQFGAPGSGPGEFNAPGQGSTDDDGNVYISDSGNARIQVFDENGKFLRQFGVAGKKPGQLLRPIDAHVDVVRKRVLVTDIFSKRVTVFDMNGKILQTIGSPGLGVGQFSAPHSVVVEPESGDIFVSDMVTNSIQRFDKAGKYKSRIGSYGLSLGEYKTPAGLAPLKGNIYVMDHTNHRGQVFNAKSGAAMFAFGEGVIGIPGETVIARQKIDELLQKLNAPNVDQNNPKVLEDIKLDLDKLKAKLNKPLSSN